ncbi:MAG: 2-C-methyl-D-erythritol 4-phosphate cytidylyltransferase [Clostridia bacterium]|jgi:2-C-methyl-D-erythritol 4-phosphate cytidylyltransferase|nr:2-C-methyl-D-erythritol 4-phosphate cytidylyltransferase [Clostridia bacterium]
MDKITAVIVAGGSGKRMGMDIKKQYILLKKKEILAHTIEVFEGCDFVQEIILVVSKEEIEHVKERIVDYYHFNKVKKVVEGGKERQDSVYNGLLQTDQTASYVIIHDGARPFITQETIYNCLQKAKETGASIVAVPVKDTIKVCDAESHKVEETPNRDKLWLIQTPQIFSFELLRDAYAYAKERQLQVTDDSMIVEAFGREVYITRGEYSNIKVTTPEDLIIGEAIMSEKI